MAKAMHTDTITIGLFGGAGDLPIFIADKKGFLSGEDLQLKIVFVRSSQEQLNGLVSGTFNIAHLFADNVIAFVDEGTDFFILMGISQSLMRLIVQPNVSDFRDFKHQRLAVDFAGRGFSLALQRMLEMEGLTSSDYTLLAVGGSEARLNELRKGTAIGAPLVPPYDVIAVSEGYKCLAKPSDYLPAYQGSVCIASHQWARDNRDTLIKYIRAYVKAMDWLSENQNREEAAQILSARLGTTVEVANQALEIILDPEVGLCERGQLNVPGLETVIELRTKVTPTGQTGLKSEKYYDLTYYEDAISQIS